MTDRTARVLGVVIADDSAATEVKLNPRDDLVSEQRLQRLENTPKVRSYSTVRQLLVAFRAGYARLLELLVHGVRWAC